MNAAGCEAIGAPHRAAYDAPVPSTPSSFDHVAALARCARGDQSALAAIYQEDARFLLGVALRIVRDKALAEDVLHDAFIRIWRGAASFDAALGSGRGWITSVVRHAALNQVRRGARDVSLDEEATQALEDELALQAHHEARAGFDLHADAGQLERCLGALPSERRDCILYAYVDGCSHGEIAQRTGRPLGTVKAWLQRAMVTLRQCMNAAPSA